jgi:hypothetical protein
MSGWGKLGGSSSSTRDRGSALAGSTGAGSLGAPSAASSGPVGATGETQQSLCQRVHTAYQTRCIDSKLKTKLLKTINSHYETSQSKATNKLETVLKCLDAAKRRQESILGVFGAGQNSEIAQVCTLLVRNTNDDASSVIKLDPLALCSNKLLVFIRDHRTQFWT